MVNFALDHERCMLLARMGMGKSSAVLSVIDTLLIASDVRRALVLAPLRVARSTWPEEAAKWQEFEHLKVQTIVGTLDQRKAALRNDKADIYTCNYDVLPWLVDTIGPDNWPFDMVIADEATKIKSYRTTQGGVRAQALSDIAHDHTRRWINLTGTFCPNGLTDIWGPTWFIDKGKRLGNTYSAFENRWFGYQRAQDALNAHKTRIKRVPFPHAQPEIMGLISDIAIALNPKYWFDIKLPVVVPVYVDLPPAVKTLYRQMEREMFIHLKDYDIEAFASSGKVIKCIAEGTEVLTDSGWLPIEHVTAQHQVWDGIEWVSTHGSVCNGYRQVVECWGVKMTPDHKVLTTAGWAEAQEVLSGKPRERHDRLAVRLPDSASARRVDPAAGQQQCSGDVALPLCLRKRGGEIRGGSPGTEPWAAEVLWMPQGGDAGRGVGQPRYDRASGVGDVVTNASAVPPPRKQGLAQLRRAWHQGLQAVGRVVRRLLGGHGPNVARGSDHRQAARQRALHTEELSVGHCQGAGQQHSVEHPHQDPQGRDDRCAGRGGFWPEADHALQAAGVGVAGQASASTTRVYDIVNAGPRHRFTVRGSAGNLLVHNCMQLANGAVYTGSDEEVERGIAHWVEAHEEKLLALDEIIEEQQGEPLLVAFHFKPDLERLKKRFPKGRHINTKRDEDDFKAGLIDVAFVHAQSIGHGVDGFQNVCHAIAFFASDFNLETHDQLIERIGPMRQMQAGFDREVTVYLIMARGTIDETMFERRVAKRGVQDATMEALSYKEAA
jgi:hypothetical protein